MNVTESRVINSAPISDSAPIRVTSHKFSPHHQWFRPEPKPRAARVAKEHAILFLECFSMLREHIQILVYICTDGGA